MSGLEIAGALAAVEVVIKSADALLKTFSSLQALQQYREGRGELPTLVAEAEMRVKRMRASVARYSRGVSKKAIPGKVLRNARKEFDQINTELKELLETRFVAFKLLKHLEKVRVCNEKLRSLEHHIDTNGLVTQGIMSLHQQNMSLREQMDELLIIVRENFISKDDSEVNNLLQTIEVTRSAEKEKDDVDIIPELARKLLNALSRSGLPRETKNELVEMARKVWDGWRINPFDIEFARKRNGMPRRIGGGASGQVFLAQMKLRDANGGIIPGEFMDVAVKQFTVARSENELPQFIREVFLQIDAKHTNVVRTFGGYWPEAKEDDDEDGEDIEPYLVMERMTCNLRQALTKQLVDTVELKRRILLDILAGVAHLHQRRIVHRDIKPENVLLRVADGKIIGRAKVCDFSASRKAQQSNMSTSSIRTSAGLAGTLAYMPPEVFDGSARQANMAARDVWSFGVLMCEVLEPKFLTNLVGDHPDGLRSLVGGTKFAEKVAGCAQKISSNCGLKSIAVSCLLLDPNMRPRIEVISTRMENNPQEVEDGDDIEPCAQEMLDSNRQIVSKADRFGATTHSMASHLSAKPEPPKNPENMRSNAEMKDIGPIRSPMSPQSKPGFTQIGMLRKGSFWSNNNGNAISGLEVVENALMKIPENMRHDANVKDIGPIPERLSLKKIDPEKKKREIKGIQKLSDELVELYKAQKIEVETKANTGRAAEAAEKVKKEAEEGEAEYNERYRNLKQEVTKRVAEFNEVRKANKREEGNQKKIGAEKKSQAARAEREIGGEPLDVDRPSWRSETPNEIYARAVANETRGFHAYAADLYQEAAIRGHISAMVARGRCLIGLDDEASVGWFRAGAERGGPTAWTELGHMYARGYGVERSYPHAVMCWQRAATLGDSAARSCLGLAYIQGFGVEKDADKGVAMVKECADSGDVISMRNLAWVYRTGRGVPKDLMAADYWDNRTAQAANASGGSRTAQPQLHPPAPTTKSPAQSSPPSEAEEKNVLNARYGKVKETKKNYVNQVENEIRRMEAEIEDHMGQPEDQKVLPTTPGERKVRMWQRDFNDLIESSRGRASDA